MKLNALGKRAERQGRNLSHVDLNLVALIDIFTILIFFLLSSGSGVETLASPKAVRLPESTANKAAREGVVVMVSATDILVDGRKLASVAEVMATEGDVIEPLRAELDLLGKRALLRADPQALGKSLTILGDKDIPYRLLRKVMVTATRADFNEISFAVRMRDAS